MSRKYVIRCPYCGYESRKTLVLLKLDILFSERYVHVCPRCHKHSVWVQDFLLKHDFTDKLEKEANKGQLFDERIRVT